MQRNLLPFSKTGWFYLLLVIWGALIVLVSLGGFQALDRLNRDLLNYWLPTTNVSSSLVRISTPLNEANLAGILTLQKAYPKTPMVLLGLPSQQLLTNLVQQRQINKSTNRIIIATEAKASNTAISTLVKNQSWYDPVITKLRFEQNSKIHWRASMDLIYAPIWANESGGLPLIWRANGNLYPTALAEALILDDRLSKTPQLKGAFTKELALDTRKISLGWQGLFFASQDNLTSYSLAEFLAAKMPPPHVFIIDDGLSPMGSSFSNNLNRLLNERAVYQSLPIKLASFLALLVALIVLWRIKTKKIAQQVLFVFIWIFLLIAAQYITFTQLQWMPVVVSLITLLSSWLILLAYAKEQKAFEQLQQRHNRLLGDSVGTFYHAGNIDKLQSHLGGWQPDAQVAERFFDVALQAEAVNNQPLAKQLLNWLGESGVKHSDSASKLAEMNAQSKTQSLDSTMVIEPGQTPSPTLTNMIQHRDSFGRYKVEGVLGKGAMGLVYQGVDPKINRHVAIKTLILDDDGDKTKLSETKARFFREAETAGNLSHANIVTIYDVGEEDELGYIAMDLLTGAPLSEFIKVANRLPAALVYQLMIQICSALDYAHRQNVVHRDIKPANIIFDDEIQRVTVTDFGIAFVADNSKTRTGTIMGSPYYMSPEQVLGSKVDGRSDIFSLGVTFYQLLSGHLPFNGESIASVAYHITKSKPRAVRHWDPKLPASATRIINKALQKDTSKRYQTMAEMKQVLVNALKRDFKKVPIG